MRKKKRTQRQRSTAKRARKSAPKPRVARKPTSKKTGSRRASPRAKSRRQHTNDQRRRSATRDDTQRKAAHALRLMRQGHASLTRAARVSRVSPSTIRRLAGSALRKEPTGRYSVRPSDRLARVVRIPTVDGIRDVTLRRSQDARLLGEYWNAVHAYLARGDAARLERFRGLHVSTVDGKRIPLLTHRASLDILGSAGVLSFESMYARTV